jgi:hypothetical protein
MPRQYNSSFTMFVYLKGHNLLEYYFTIPDARVSANDWDVASGSDGISVSPGEPWRCPR